MRLNKLIFFSLLTFIFVGCTHSLHVAHVSDFSPTFKEYSKGELVKARAEQFTVMGIVTDTNYVNDAYTKLLASCSGGSIQGITTQYSTSHGFFSWTNVIDMQGLCIR
ncbi:MAG: hypothetical protein IPM97_08380 [Bdellovibrionaceae bacterium]|nr:hypothetical protein [Pseudobdellovibrionaceae bacterium]